MKLLLAAALTSALTVTANAEPELLRRLEGQTARITSVAFSPDSR